MSHFQMKRWLDEYRDGTLPPRMRLRVEEHLRVCLKCRERMELIRWAEGIVRESNRSDEVPTASPWFAQKVIRRIRQAQSESATLWIPVYRLAQKTIPLILLLALLMGGLTYYEWSRLNPEGTDNPLVSSFSDPSDKWGEQMIAGGKSALFPVDPEENSLEQPAPAVQPREAKKK